MLSRSILIDFHCLAVIHENIVKFKSKPIPSRAVLCCAFNEFHELVGKCNLTKRRDGSVRLQTKNLSNFAGR